jgi:hypothetical protein
MLSEVFYTFLITSIIGCLGMTFRMLYKSKCKQFQICCLKVVRDTEGEEILDRVEYSKAEEK